MIVFSGELFTAEGAAFAAMLHYPKWCGQGDLNPPTLGLKDRYSDQLSYTRKKLVATVGFEPTT